MNPASSRSRALPRLLRSILPAASLAAVFLLANAPARGAANADAGWNSSAAQPSADASSGFTFTGSLSIAREYHTATLLPSGRVLVAAGTNGHYLNNAELYDPATGLWTATGNLRVARYSHTATLLQDGRVLVAGGFTARGATTSSELYDPATGTWTATGNLNFPRVEHTATLLADGRVLVAGGLSGSAPGTAEIYDPATGTWTRTGDLLLGRSYHTATLLPDGQVLVAGGLDVDGFNTADAELYDPASGQWTDTGNLQTGRFRHTANLLANGLVLVTGGSDAFSRKIASSELYDPATGKWKSTGDLQTARELHQTTLLANGMVLAEGGTDGSQVLASAEVYNPASGMWSATGDLNTAREDHTATLLPDGSVLVAGGYNPTLGHLASAELYQPAVATANLVSAASRLSHGTAGTFDIDMPLTGPSGVEDRRSSTYQAVFTFDNPVTSADISVTAGTATLGEPVFAGNVVTVPLTGVADAQVVTLQVANVNGSGLPGGTVDFGFLIGDVDGDRAVDRPDRDQLLADKGQPVTAANFRDDMDLSGVVDRGDLQLLKANKNHKLP